MNCDEIRLLLESDAPDVEESAALREHLRTCEECAAYAAAMGEQDAIFSSAMKTRIDEVSFERIKLKVGRGIDRERASRNRWRMVAIAGGIAAMVLVVVTAIGSTRGGPDSPSVAEKVSAPAPGLGAADVFHQVAELQAKIRTTQVLDELAQLQAAMDAPEDQDGKSTAEDAELYIERILALNGSNEQAYRETLLGVDRSGISTRLRKLRDSLTADAPKPVVAALELAIATFEQSGKIAQLSIKPAHLKEVASAE